MIYPLPAVLVSCGDASGLRNLLTVAWTGTVCTDPPMCYVSIRRERHSYDIIRRTGEFVINLTTEELARATDWCGVRSGRDCDKFAEMGLTPGRGAVVAAPTVEEAPISIECRVRQVLPLGSHDMFLAEVVNVQADERYLDAGGRLDFERARPLVYSHGEYFGLGGAIGRFGWSVRKKPQAPRGERVVEPARAAASEQDRKPPVRGLRGLRGLRGRSRAGPRRRKEQAAAVRRVRNADNSLEYALRYAPYLRFLSHGHRAPYGRRHRPGSRRCEPLRLRPRALRGVARHPAA